MRRNGVIYNDHSVKNRAIKYFVVERCKYVHVVCLSGGVVPARRKRITPQHPQKSEKYADNNASSFYRINSIHRAGRVISASPAPRPHYPVVRRYGFLITGDKKKNDMFHMSNDSFFETTRTPDTDLLPSWFLRPPPLIL